MTSATIDRRLDCQGDAVLPPIPLLLVRIDPEPVDRSGADPQRLYDTRNQRELFLRTVRWWPLRLQERSAWLDGATPAPTHVIGTVDAVAVQVLALSFALGHAGDAFTELADRIELPARPTTFDDPVNNLLYAKRLHTGPGVELDYQDAVAGIRRWNC